ncbi:MAG TPA: hypothetical protein PKA06_05700, partial [Gemmatales bacterium]|nr:hypothetical protein [Gemmatales bacterium]
MRILLSMHPNCRDLDLTCYTNINTVKQNPFFVHASQSVKKNQPDTWTTFNTHSLLGGALLGQKKYTEAESLLLKGYEGMIQRDKTIPAIAKVRLAEALNRLIQLYTET